MPHKDPVVKKAYMRAYAKKNAEHAKAERRRQWKEKYAERDRNKWYKRHYGITIAEYDVLLESQEFRCKICKKHESENSRGGDKPVRLYVDHDHATGRIRGLLCHHCNSGVGHLGDGLLLERALQYVRGEL